MPKHIPFVFLPACLSNATGHGVRHILSIVSVFMISCSLGLTGCGGGGGSGSAGTGAKVPVTYDSQPTSAPISPLIWVTGSDEYEAQSGLAEVTIKHHLKSLRSKLGARNRTHAVCRAIELGIAEEGVQPL